MFVIAELKPRAETTDTVLHFVVNTEAEAEEFLLSLFNEYVENEITWFQYNIPELELDYDKLYEFCRKKLSGYYIIKVPFVG